MLSHPARGEWIEMATMKLELIIVIVSSILVDTNQATKERCHSRERGDIFLLVIILELLLQMVSFFDPMSLNQRFNDISLSALYDIDMINNKE